MEVLTLDKQAMNHFNDSHILVSSIVSGIGQALLPDIYYLPIQIVNVTFIGEANSDNWVLVDTGMPHSANIILNKAKERFGENHPPSAILLTHGHFDHVGALADLLEHWDVPVYAHQLEIPYLTGQKDYPKGDPKVNGGFLSEISPFYPNHGIDLGDQVQILPTDGSVPELPDWRWIHTPGHTPGHASFYRSNDRTLIVGDAFINVKQESLYRVVMQKEEISGPPKYFTTDWQKAQQSVETLEQLKPELAVTGHGFPLSGNQLRMDLGRLAMEFNRIAMPSKGRFVN